jgi:spore coat polysaccharide biosynthesis protein SpsF
LDAVAGAAEVTVACIVQARLGSTRLPAKVLLKLPNGRAVLEEVLTRCKQIAAATVIVAALPDTEENDVLLGYIPSGVTVVRGSEHNLLARYAAAAEAVDASIIMRITADCPLLDPSICGALLALYASGGYDYCSNSHPVRTFPAGLDCEVFNREALQRAMRNPTTPEEREHVGPAIQKSCGERRRGLLQSAVDRSHIRWTLDTKDDIPTIWQAFAELMAV